MLTSGPVYLCRQAGSRIGAGSSRARIEEFEGKHPAGTVGYHIHVLDPVHRRKTVFNIGYQDVVRIGRLFATGSLDPTCVVALAGPMITRPRLIRTRLGAATDQLVAGELMAGDPRVVSGSVLHGDRADGVQAFLGRYHGQISVLAEGRQRELLGWLAPGVSKFSVIPTFLSALMPRQTYAMNTSTHGSRRPMVPIGLYERVMPMDLMPSHLLRALTVADPEWAEELGVLELDEEDLGLCTFVCPGKFDYGPALRRVLTILEREG
jgi:Na+-transporting NADH:ubiquinone oxidoreductase subunit A